MSIEVLREGRMFHLRTSGTSYVFGLNRAGRLQHYFYGGAMRCPEMVAERVFNPSPASFNPRHQDDPGNATPDQLPQEYGGCNSGDMRLPALSLRTADGARWCDPRYVSHEVTRGSKAPLHGLPQSFPGRAAESCEQLSLRLSDPYAGVEVTLLYTVFAECDVIARSVVVRNVSGQALTLERAMSAQIDLVGKADYEMVCTSGSWSRERHLQRTALHTGLQASSSLRGATGHVQTPGIVLCAPETTEEAGEAYAFCLAYSGNHWESAEVEQFGGVRVQVGINPELFAWRLEPGESFETPEMFMTVSESGFGAMSRHLHDFIRGHIIRSPWNGRQRPILVNNWEATYFRFDSQKIIDIAAAAAKLNIEMLVLDDGWFGHRDDDRTSLGDWFEFESKVGDMAELAGAIHGLGLKFGLWYEPEMISEDSELYRAHPDWVLCVPGRPRSYGRTQLILDFSREEVVRHLFDVMSAMIRKARIDYIKWDMNRNMTEVFSAALPPERQGEVAHRYILGVYRLHEMLIAEFPELLIEGCSGGGGRFDAGMLYYLPQIWCSDNTDAMDRLAIQAGTSLFYPVASMGAHVNAQHQPWRLIPFETRGNVAMAGTFGYELDLTRLTEEERQTAIRLNASYHRYHDTISEGDYYRLTDMFRENDVEAWCAVAKDRSQAVLTAVRRTKVGYIARQTRLRVPGLAPEASYRLTVNGQDTGLVFPGDVLGVYGLWTNELPWADCVSAVYLLERV